jgi:hypothetical protein
MFVAESERLTHQGAKMIMATALELAGQTEASRRIRRWARSWGRAK